MKKIFAVLLASMMAATALVGCGGSGDSSTASKTESNGNGASATSSDFGDEDNITLKVWAPDKAVSTFEKECEAFKALYPDKKIDITVVAQTEKDAATNLLNDASAAADVFGFASAQGSPACIIKSLMTRWNNVPSYVPSSASLMKLSRCCGVSLYSFTIMSPAVVSIFNLVS